MEEVHLARSTGGQYVIKKQPFPTSDGSLNTQYYQVRVNPGTFVNFKRAVLCIQRVNEGISESSELSI